MKRKKKRSEICIVDLNQYFFIWFQCSRVLSSISSFLNEDAIELGRKTVPCIQLQWASLK